MKKKSNKGINDYIFYLDDTGIIRVSYGGKVMFLLLTGVLALWFLMLVIVNAGEIKREGKQGLVIFILSIISLSLLVLTVFQKFFLINFFINLSRQISVLTFFTTVFMFIRVIPKSTFENKKIYENPSEICYVFIFFYFISFYILHNFSNR